MVKKAIAVMLSRGKKIEIALWLETNDFRARNLEIVDVISPFPELTRVLTPWQLAPQHFLDTSGSTTRSHCMIYKGLPLCQLKLLDHHSRSDSLLGSISKFALNVQPLRSALDLAPSRCL